MKTRRTVIFTSLLLCTFLGAQPLFQQLAAIPELKEQSDASISQVSGILSHVVQAEPLLETDAVMASNMETSDVIQVSYKLFGIFPLKTSQIEVMPDIKLLPGGQSIGVSLQAKGVMVVGQAAVTGSDGKQSFPAKEAGIEVGDVILKIENQDVKTDQDVANAIHQAGQKQGYADILCSRNGQYLQKRITTIYCPETHRYRVGLYVRNEAAGVGTLTFYDPQTGKYGALGHVINDADTNQKIEVANGSVIASSIYAIEKGRRGHPGEKVGSFVSQSLFTGNIERNSISGIFGTMQGKVTNPYFNDAVSVAWEAEIKEGPAKIYTVLDGEKIEEFDVQIERVMHNRTDSKNMVIRVVDQRLLDRTGGIIQGMSGSPIIQEGKIVGAVTHVFVNDATRGYGVFIQNMLNETGLIGKTEAA
ncbi:SpoIVB peptidase [Desulfitobacterium sp.]|uniref:SpoIVB peptidase n=1 Tax=Desulfitobacterium sp. TaxID=49981 RepID=UPI002B1F54A5|nr:SpoIVB peptidase [Desulfitobacterium sp.]MEA4902450.1 SpoIVB peptidase [Desulfitobacterium sp.]